MAAQTVLIDAAGQRRSPATNAVSIRRVASELGVRPMSIYTYITSKDELLDRMAEAVVSEILITESIILDDISYRDLTRDEGAPVLRHGAAGNMAIRGDDPEQHCLWSTGGDRRGDRGGGRGSLRR